MALGIYKPGQGYWVRVLTATLMAVATIAVGAWAWYQTATFVSQIPKSTYEMGVKNTPIDVPGGTTVSLMGIADAEGRQTEIGTATLRTPLTKSAIAQKVVIDVVDLKPTLDASGTASLRVIGGERIADVTDRKGIAPFETQTAQAIVVTIVILIGAILAYFFTAMRPRSVDFLIATDYEMKRVNWSTRREIMGSTFIVIIAALALSVTLFVFDLTLRWVFSSIDVLQI